MKAYLRARKDRDSSFHHWEGAVNLVQAGLSTRRHRESSFQHSGCAVKLVLACEVPGRTEIVVLIIVEICEVRVGMFKSQKRSRKQFLPL